MLPDSAETLAGTSFRCVGGEREALGFAAEVREKGGQQACLLVALPRLAAGEAVTTVALDLGYDSPAAFSTMFKRMLGASPNSYRPGAAAR